MRPDGNNTVTHIVLFAIIGVSVSASGLDAADELGAGYRRVREAAERRDAAKRVVPVIPPKEERIRVVFDTDAKNEIEDIWALALAVLSPERFQIEGFVAANFDNRRPEAGPDSIEASAREIETILAKAGLVGKYPIKRGSPPMRYKYEPSESEGVDFIIAKAMASTPQDPLWIVGLGAATDIASAYLKEPRIAERVRVFGTFAPAGRTSAGTSTSSATCEPPASSSIPTCPSCSSTPAPICPARWNSRRNSSRAARWANTCTNTARWANTCTNTASAHRTTSDRTRASSSYYQRPDKGFFDLGDIAALVDPDLASWEVVHCPEVDWDLAYKHRKTKGKILRCYDIDRDKTMQLLHARLKTWWERMN